MNLEKPVSHENYKNEQRKSVPDSNTRGAGESELAGSPKKGGGEKRGGGEFLEKDV